MYVMKIQYILSKILQIN